MKNKIISGILILITTCFLLFFYEFIFKTKKEINAIEHAYEQGNILERHRNFDSAIYWYEKGEKLGSVECMIKLGDIYSGFNQLDTPKNLSKAIEYYQRAAHLLNVVAMIRLGNIYSTNEYGIEADLDRSIYWYKCAARRGHLNWALLNLGDLYLSKKNHIHKAYAYYCLSLYLGSPIPPKYVLENFISPLKEKMDDSDFNMASKCLRDIVSDLYGIESDDNIDVIIAR